MTAGYCSFAVRRHLPEPQLWIAQKDARLSPAEAVRLLVVRYRLVDHVIVYCNISWAAGTFAGSGVMTATLGYSPVGITAPDGAVIKTAVWIRYSGPALLKDVRLALASPVGSTNTGRWASPQ